MARRIHVSSVESLSPGERRIVNAGGIDIGVFNIDGAIYAIPNLCVHQWGPLCAGDISGTLTASASSDWRYEWVRDGSIIVCPWHSLEFDVTTGQCLAYPRVKLRRYEVVIEDGAVYVVI
jgi:nitrite reductase (NADH) small subunit